MNPNSHIYAPLICTDNPCLSWSFFCPAQASSIFHWPGQAERPLSEVRDERKAFHDPGRSMPADALAAIVLQCSEIRVPEKSQAECFNSDHLAQSAIEFIFHHSVIV